MSLNGIVTASQSRLLNTETRQQKILKELELDSASSNRQEGSATPCVCEKECIEGEHVVATMHGDECKGRTDAGQWTDPRLIARVRDQQSEVTGDDRDRLQMADDDVNDRDHGTHRW